MAPADVLRLNVELAENREGK